MPDTNATQHINRGSVIRVVKAVTYLLIKDEGLEPCIYAGEQWTRCRPFVRDTYILNIRQRDELFFARLKSCHEGKVQRVEDIAETHVHLSSAGACASGSVQSGE